MTSLQFLWVMRVCIVWVKGKKITLKILQAKSFTGISRVGHSRETLTKLTAWHDSSASIICFSCGSFASKLLAKSTCSSHTCSILYQLNTKLNTIKSHKIQGTKLKQLPHFLSWNKVNIKHSCKSQLYNIYKYIYIYISFSFFLFFSFFPFPTTGGSIRFSPFFFFFSLC